MPTMPQKAAGWRMEPPVSLPSAAGRNPAATAAAEPPEEPPGTLVVSSGLAVGWKELFSQLEPMANSSMFSRPKGMKPLAVSFCTAVAE